MEFEPHEWHFMQDGDDIAAVDVTDRLERESDQFSSVPDDLFATKEFMQSVGFGIGEDGFMLGLFADQPGKNRNLVAARFGNVSLLADEQEPIRQPNRNYGPAHLFDMRSRPGFSGSPVFTYRTPAGDLRTATERGRDKVARRTRFPDYVSRMSPEEAVHFMQRQTSLMEQLELKDNIFLMLLGIHVAQYHDRVAVKKRPRVARGEAAIIEGDELDVPNSVAVVVPAWRVTALLNEEILLEQRRERDAADAEKEGNHPRPEASGRGAKSPSTTADNPSHNEEFTSLETKRTT